MNRVKMGELVGVVLPGATFAPVYQGTQGKTAPILITVTMCSPVTMVARAITVSTITRVSVFLVTLDQTAAIFTTVFSTPVRMVARVPTVCTATPVTVLLVTLVLTAAILTTVFSCPVIILARVLIVSTTTHVAVL